VVITSTATTGPKIVAPSQAVITSSPTFVQMLYVIKPNGRLPSVTATDGASASIGYPFNAVINDTKIIALSFSSRHQNCFRNRGEPPRIRGSTNARFWPHTEATGDTTLPGGKAKTSLKPVRSGLQGTLMSSGSEMVDPRPKISKRGPFSSLSSAHEEALIHAQECTIRNKPQEQAAPNQGRPD